MPVVVIMAMIVVPVVVPVPVPVVMPSRSCSCPWSCASSCAWSWVARARCHPHRPRPRVRTVPVRGSPASACGQACRPAHDRVRAAADRAAIPAARGDCRGGMRARSRSCGDPCSLQWRTTISACVCRLDDDQRAVFCHQHVAPRATAPRARNTPSARPLESVASKRLFRRTSQSSSTLAARFNSALARPRGPVGSIC